MSHKTQLELAIGGISVESTSDKQNYTPRDEIYANIDDAHKHLIQVLPTNLRSLANALVGVSIATGHVEDESHATTIAVALAEQYMKPMMQATGGLATMVAILLLAASFCESVDPAVKEDDTNDHAGDASNDIQAGS